LCLAAPPAGAQFFQFGQPQQPYQQYPQQYPPRPQAPAQPKPGLPPLGRTQPPGAPQSAAPVPPQVVSAPYDHDLQRLSEILGALHFLRGICNGNEGQKWRTEAQALIDAEADALAHMNADHAEAIRLYATKLLGADDGPWRLTGIDPEGIDLAQSDGTLRLPFLQRVTTTETLRKALVNLATQARAD